MCKERELEELINKLDDEIKKQSATIQLQKQGISSFKQTICEMGSLIATQEHKIYRLQSKLNPTPSQFMNDKHIENQEISNAIARAKNDPNVGYL